MRWIEVVRGTHAVESASDLCTSQSRRQGLFGIRGSSSLMDCRASGGACRLWVCVRCSMRRSVQGHKPRQRARMHARTHATPPTHHASRLRTILLAEQKMLLLIMMTMIMIIFRQSSIKPPSSSPSPTQTAPPLTTTMPSHADLLTTLRNASLARVRTVPVPSTSANISILSILLQQGLIHSITKGTYENPSSPSAFLQAPPPAQRYWVTLKYSPINQRPVLSTLELISKPSKRVFMDRDEMIRWSTHRRAQFVSPLNTGEIGIVEAQSNGARGKPTWFEVREAIQRGIKAGEIIARAG